MNKKCILSNFESKPSLDSWSIGVILFYLCFQFFPFTGFNLLGPNPDAIKNSILNNKLEIPPNKYSKNLNSILKKLLDKDEKSRMAMLHLVNHDWFKKANESGIDFLNLDNIDNLQNNLSPVVSPNIKKEDEKTMLSKLELLLESREDIKEDAEPYQMTTPSKELINPDIKVTNSGEPKIKKTTTYDLNKSCKKEKINLKMANSQDNSPMPIIHSNQTKGFQSNSSKVSQFAPPKSKETSKKSKTIYFIPSKSGLKASGKFK